MNAMSMHTRGADKGGRTGSRFFEFVAALQTLEQFVYLVALHFYAPTSNCRGAPLAEGVETGSRVTWAVVDDCRARAAQMTARRGIMGIVIVTG